MPQTAIYFSDVNERQGAFHRRTFLLGGLAGGGILALTARLGYLQLLESGRYQKLAASNQFNFKLVPPPRGVILDRNGVVLASNRPNFRLLVRREEDLDHEATLKTLANFVPLDPQRQAKLAKEIDRSPRRVPVQVMEDMTWDQFSAINLRAPELPGVVADMGEVRVYPHGGAFAHVIGYVAKPIREDIKDTGPNSDPILLHPGFRIGRQGVEKAFDLDLRGKPGAQKVEVDANGREVSHDPDGDIPAIPGKQIQLTLDVDVQTRAIEVFGEESGAAVMMDCRTGDLLCLASAPSFDANRFVRGLSGPEYRALANYERRPLLDKALSGLYPPGSTFKTMTALAALDAGVDPNAQIFCGGGWYFGRFFHCHKRGGHGPQTMREALKNSCDVYFYQVALRIGPDQIAKAAKAFGFEQIFDIGISGQKKGIVPSREWKRRYYKKTPANQEWMPGESLSYGIGQGALQVNALQMAVMTARLANGRKALNPRLIKAVGDQVLKPGSEAPDLPFKKEHIDYVREGMAAVTEAGGTGFRASQLGLGDILMAGKTGTAQVRNYSGGGSRGKGGPWKYRDHGLFVCFAPIDEPRYALSVVVQHGLGGSTAAAPRAREIMRVALLKDPEIRARIEQPLPMPELPDEGEVDIPDPPSEIAPDAAPQAPIAAPPGAPA